MPAAGPDACAAPAVSGRKAPVLFMKSRREPSPAEADGFLLPEKFCRVLLIFVPDPFDFSPRLCYNMNKIDKKILIASAGKGV